METFTALADPTRRQIVEMLAGGGRAAGGLPRPVDKSAPPRTPPASRRLVSLPLMYPMDAQRRIYSLDPEGIETVENWLAQIRRFWGPKLDALESALNAAAERDRENDRN